MYILYYKSTFCLFKMNYFRSLAPYKITEKYPYDCIVVSSIQLMAIKPETQQPIIVIILIIYSPYLLKDLVEH